MLSQIQDGNECVLTYFSNSLSKEERNYCVTRRELFAVVRAIKYCHHYLYGREFLMRTDHASLNWLMNFKNPEGQIARWFQFLSTYNFKIEHKVGKKHGNADGLSRRSCIPCHYCDTKDRRYASPMTECNTRMIKTPCPTLNSELLVESWPPEMLQKWQKEDIHLSKLFQWMTS